MKRLIALMMGTMMCLSITFKKAEAGVVYTTTSCIALEWNNAGGPPVSCIVFGLIPGAALTALGLVASGVTIFFNPRLAGKMALGSIVLDSQNSSGQERVLSEKFPFIDNQNVIKELAASLRSEYDKYNTNEKKLYVTLPAEKVKGILEQADLSSGEINQVVLELK